MTSQPKIYVAGHTGMVGGAIVEAVRAHGYENIVTRPRRELPLDDRAKVDGFFAEARPDWVFLAAAKVGGIIANDTGGADFIRENLLIQTHVIDAAWRHGAQRLLFLGSSCIYPKQAEQPIRESSLLTGPLEPTNSAYAVAKIAGKEMCDAYAKQHGFDAFTAMPCNVYGIGDNFHPEHSHVAAGLMRRFHEAKMEGRDSLAVWGTGKPLREFIFSKDIGEACLFLMEHYREGGMINAGSGQEISIRDLAELIREIVGYEGAVTFDSSKPDGTMRKLMDNSRINALGWRPATDLEDGLRQMYGWFLEHGDRGRSGR
ncbi:MAG: GDP-L-fucose synthase family protein [Parasphingopyxis sp.]|uniref:GDP-L-fucose synthase family protein n=1 Tax=Parasphingopyxis sp. TaxID=1920299 RepID=UPI003FA05794